ncbi:MAG: SRPBCC domain-containing protein [Spirochaetes bacterium]|jgi:hypothetical protein|nr:SRPBCC domain-containing protein [Spirochaetota bacterium]
MKKVPFAVLFIIVALLLLGSKSITTEIVIDASAEKVWNELTDFNSYPEWNPFIRKVTGEIKPGNQIEVTFQIGEEKPMVFTPVIKQIEKNRLLQWEGKLFLPGIFTGKHTVELIVLEPNKTKLAQSEDFYGIIVPFFNFDSTVRGFESMNRAFKERAETN